MLMTLEKVKKNPYREDLFSKEIVQKHGEVDFNEKLIIKDILIEEVS